MNDESKKKDERAERPKAAGVKVKSKVRAGGDDWEARV